MMNDDELAGIIKAHVEQGLGSDLGDISQGREEVFDRYVGELYGNEVEGESKVTTREVFETIEWALPPLLRHYASQETPVEFEPEDSRDEMAAQLETRAVRDQFWKDNNGFTTLYLMFKTVMMNPNGYVKVFREKMDRVVFEHYSNMTVADVAMIEDDPELTMIEAEEDERDKEYIIEDDEPLYTVKIKRKLTKGRNLVLVLPEDEVVIDSDWQKLELDECPFVCHYPDKTQSELMQMGVPEDLLDEIYGSGSEADSSEEINRRNYSDETYADDETHKALRKFRYHECSMLVDYDEDGIAERRRVVMINDHIWENEEDDEQCIIAAGSILMPHKHVQMSLAQTILDLQEINTTIHRQLLNNMYRANNPRTIVTKGANLADVLANRTNGLLRAKSPDDITIEPTNPIIGQVVPLIQLIEDTKEMRTGITKNSTVPNQDMMRDTAQGSFLAMVEKADQRIDLLARLFGETIVKQIYLKLHRLIKINGDLYEQRFDGDWVPTDPTKWRDRSYMTCRVGLGYNGRQARLVTAQTIKADHDLLLDKGAVAIPEEGKKGIVTIQNIYEGRKFLVESLGEDANRFYTNPAKIPPAPPAPPPIDPNLLLIQSNERIEGGKRQVDIMKLQSDQMQKRVEMQSKFALEERKMHFDQMEAAYEARIKELQQEITMAGQADKAQVEQQKVEIDALKAQLADAQHDEELALKKYLGELQEQTKITLKEMELGIQAIDQVQAVSDNQNETLAQQQRVTEALNALSGMIQEMRQPKEIAYDSEGEIIGTRNPLTGEVKPLRRDPNGNPVGL